jgi:hypothetical protein
MGDRRPLPVLVVSVATGTPPNAVLDALLGLPVIVVDGTSSLPAPAALGGAVFVGAPGAAVLPRAALWARKALAARLPVLGVGAGARAVAAALHGLNDPAAVAIVEDMTRPAGRAAIARFARRMAAARRERLPARRCGTEERRRDIYQEALDLLAAHGGKLRLDQAAAELYVSRRQLQRVFAELGATTFSEAKRRVG